MSQLYINRLLRENQLSIELNQDINILTKYNLNLKLDKKFIKDFSEINDLYKKIFKIDEEYHLLNVFKSYEKNKNLELIHYTHKIEHDGFDAYGPQSNLHDLTIYYRKNNDCNIYIDKYWREYWYKGEDDDPYEKCNLI